MKTLQVENIVPILSVRHIPASRIFYRDLLGFEESLWGNDEFTRMGINNCYIYLSKQSQGQPPTWVWVGFNGDIYALYEDLRAKQIRILMPPTNYSWALEMQVEDPDGHVLRFGTEPDENKPFKELE